MVTKWRVALRAFALALFAGQLTGAANGFGLFAGTLLRRLFIAPAQLHFAENPFTLHFFLQRFESLIDIVVADNDLNDDPSSWLPRFGGSADRGHNNKWPGYTRSRARRGI